MFFNLFLLFTLGPMIELYFLIKIGGMIGAFNTIGIMLLTGCIGAFLAQAQGLQVLFEIQRAQEQGRMPLEEILNGSFVLIGGLLLITPGFVTDIMGFLFLIPVSRTFLKRLLRKYLEKKIKKNNVVIDIHRMD